MIINRTADVARGRGITTITDLAARTGLAYNTAHALFTGRTTRIDHETLDRLCAALGVQPGDLLVYVSPASAGDGLTALATSTSD
jgi:putative transcriptional regulator